MELKLEKERAEKAKQPKLLEDGKPPFRTGFKVYKLAKSNFPRIEFIPEAIKTEADNLKLLENYIEEKETLKELANHKDTLFICLERSLAPTMKWNLKHLLGDKLIEV